MNAFSQILAHWLDRQDEPFALATITHAEGSTYRKTGARMLVDFGGQTVGMLSGGCLEEEIARRAKIVMREEKPEVVSYDTRRLFGCNGAVDILIEPLCRQEPDALLAAAAQCFQRRTALVATALVETQGQAPGPLGSYALFAEDGARFGTRAYPESFAADAAHALGVSRALERSYELVQGSMKVLLQSIAPPLRLVICGAGPDAIPLAELAMELGWETTVIAAPSQSSPNLPQGCRVLQTVPEALPDVIKADARTYTVIMSHHYGRDLAFLSAALSMPFRYVGLLGPAHRRDRLLGDLGDLGQWPADDALEFLHSPIGLDLGADGPEEVALSIIAEIQAVAHGRGGGLLRQRRGPIHAEAVEVS